MRNALAYAEHHSSTQLQSDAQSTAALRSELQFALSQLQTETTARRAAQKAHAEATSEFAVHLKLMGSRLKEKFDERERALLHELAVQKDEFRQLQLKLATVRPPVVFDDMAAGAATSSRVAPNLRTEVDFYDISSQKSDDNADLNMWQQNLPRVAGVTMPPCRRVSGTLMAPIPRRELTKLLLKSIFSRPR